MTYQIDRRLRPTTPELPADEHGRRPVAVVEDSNGVPAEFVATELLVDSKDALEDVIQATGGTLVGSDAVPAPPPGLERTRDVDPEARMWVVRVDASKFPLDSLDADTEALGAVGPNRISSDDGARLLALVARLKREGSPVAVNFLATGDRLPFTASPEGFGIDALALSEYQATGCKSSVTQAWQFVQAYQSLRATPRVRVAVLDGGFWLSPSGQPLSKEGGPSDLPSRPVQYDFVGDDYIADGMNPANCSGGGGCPWHGNGSASVATATVNNRIGAAGTGGLVADAWLFRLDSSNAQIERAVRTATAWGADVVNISSSGHANWWWRTFNSFTYFMSFIEARVNGVVVVSSAGNGRDGITGEDVNDNDVIPCTHAQGVICVGAIANSGNTSMGYSNFGAGVDIWAPTNITAIPDGGPAPGTTTHTGTSASAPFIAGVAALLKAIDPSLDSDAVREILERTAWRDSPDAKVSRYVNAYASVLDAAAGHLPPDRFEQNNDASRAAMLQLQGGTGNWETLAISDKNDRDWFRFSLSDFASLDVDLAFVSSLGALDLDVHSADDNLGTEGDTKITTPTGRHYHADFAPPGNYLLVVNGKGPNVYDLKIDTAPASLLPDEFEANNTYETARELSVPLFAHYTRRATIHVDSDVDYYRFNAQTGHALGFDFGLMDSDVDLILHLYAADGTERKVVGPTRNTTIDLPGGVSTVKIESSRRGRYFFSYGYYISDPRLRKGALRNEHPYFYDPSDPAPRWLLGAQQMLALTADERLTKRGTHLVFSRGGRSAHLELLTLDGRVIAEGAKPAEHPRRGEELALADLEQGETYVLRVMRRDRRADSRAAVRYAIRVR